MVKAWFKNNKAEWLAVLLGVVWIFGLYSPIVLAPDDYMFSDHGDGIKNYFTFAYHVRHDAHWLEFEGMNYPNGEHVGYTDGHPLFSLLLGWLPIVQAHPVGFLNLMLLLSIPFTCWVLFKLLRQNGASEWMALAGALAINWLNPQIFRMEGHLALSYAFVIPLSLLLIIRLMKHNTWLNMCWYMLYSLAIFFIHPYLGIAMAMVGSAALVYAVFSWKRGFDMLRSALATVAPVLIYLVFMKLTDTHTDRAPDAKGYLFFSASYETIFVPNQEPFRHLMSQLIKVRMQQWEGWAYLGLTTMFIVIVSFLVRPLRVFRMLMEERHWLAILFIAIASAVFACGFPFNFKPELLHRIPFIEQFRSPGRFAWILYYSAGVFAWIILERIWMTAPRPRIQHWSMVVLALALVGVEGWWPQRHMADLISNHANVFNDKFLSEEDQLHLRALVMKKEHAVIVPLPYFHYGSDYYCWDGTQESKTKAYALSFLSGVPLFASSNPRVSLEESREHLNFFSNNTNTKKILQQCPPFTQFYFLEIGAAEKAAEKQFYGRSNAWATVEELSKAEQFVQVKDFAASNDSVALYNASGELVDTTYLYRSLSEDQWRDTRQYEIVYEMPAGTFAEDSLNATIEVDFESLNAITCNFVVERVEGDQVKYVSEMAVSNAVDHDGKKAILRLKFPYQAEYKYRFFIKGSNEDAANYKYRNLCVYPNGLWLATREGMTPDFRKILKTSVQ